MYCSTRFEIATMQILPGAAATTRNYIMGQIATIERSRLKALDIETVIALSTAHNWPRVRNMWNSLLHGHGDRTECETQLAWAMGYKAIAENK